MISTVLRLDVSDMAESYSRTYSATTLFQKAIIAYNADLIA